MQNIKLSEKMVSPKENKKIVQDDRKNINPFPTIQNIIDHDNKA